MTDFKNIEGIYFIGIGGIGMSALAHYFIKGGYTVAGYDRSSSSITFSLISEGCAFTSVDSVEELPALFRLRESTGKVLVVYTPAIPPSSVILSYFRNNGYMVVKRSEILGEISRHTDTLAIAGTHGKTTVSTMTAHLLKQSHIDCSAFLGGISKNYNSNLIVGESRYTVIEADEYDRSFHRLSPWMAVITAVDPDHLEIYGTHEAMIEGYNIFCSLIRQGGKLVVNSRIREKIIAPEAVDCFTYGTEPGADFQAVDIVPMNGYYSFGIKTPDGVMRDLHLTYPGIINIENMTAAVALAWLCGVTEDELRKGIVLFQGVKRRFDIRVNIPGLAYIDDYAHHPEEINACIRSVKEFFRGRRITGIFQPHLFTRTRDHADGFARILDELDEVILLPVYPARELPIEGVSSEMILERMKCKNKRLLRKEDLPGSLNIDELDVLVTIGAGDIDTLVQPIENALKAARIK